MHSAYGKNESMNSRIKEKLKIYIIQFVTMLSHSSFSLERFRFKLFVLHLPIIICQKDLGRFRRLFHCEG